MLRMLKKLKSIAHGWALWAFDTKESREVSKPRMAICKECPYRIKLTDTCRECGCYLPAKTRVPDETCPLLRW